MKRICSVVLVLASSALGQTNLFEIVITNPVSPDQPSTTVEVWAAFDPAEYAFAFARFDFVGSSDDGAFSDPVLKISAPGDYEGDVSPDGDSVVNVAPGQLHWWNGGPYADTSNPLLIWSVTWSTSDFHPRRVDMFTLTTEFYLYVDDAGSWGSFIDEFMEGTGAIQVVPSPGGLCGLGLFGVLMPRRRHRGHQRCGGYR